jgi:hypothetical protein
MDPYGIKTTNGYYIFKYNNRYYTFLNIYDSYPDWLGKKIVNELRTLDDAEFNRIKKLLKKLNPIQYNCKETSNFTSLIETLENPYQYTFWLLDFEPTADVFIEYIYIIDLDKEIFKVKHFHMINDLDMVKYKLKEIPEDWDSLLD